jgi:hypothetical protein
VKPKTSAVGPHSDFDKFADNLDDLSIHGSAMRTEEESASGAHHGADRRDHWANLKDLFINIKPLKVANCYFVHMHRRIDSSSSRSDPSANGYIDLDYSARLHLTLQRRCTTAADLDDLVQLWIVPHCPRAAAMSSTTSTSRGRSATRRRLHQLLVST